MSEFKYYDSPQTDINVIGTTDDRHFDNKANTVTYNDFFEVENNTGHTVGGVIALPYIWAVVPKDSQSTLGNAGLVPLDLNKDGVWTAKNFNGKTGLDLQVTAEILPSDHDYTTGSVSAESIASNAGLDDDFGPSSADYPIKAPFPPEMLDATDLIPLVNLGELEAHEDVTFSLKFTYHWTQDKGKVSYDDALATAGAVHSLELVDDLWPV
jgi:hypothetical protein